MKNRIGICALLFCAWAAQAQETVHMPVLMRPAAYTTPTGALASPKAQKNRPDMLAAWSVFSERDSVPLFKHPGGMAIRYADSLEIFYATAETAGYLQVAPYNPDSLDINNVLSLSPQARSAWVRKADVVLWQNALHDEGRTHARRLVPVLPRGALSGGAATLAKVIENSLDSLLTLASAFQLEWRSPGEPHLSPYLFVIKEARSQALLSLFPEITVESMQERLLGWQPRPYLAEWSHFKAVRLRLRSLDSLQLTGRRFCIDSALLDSAQGMPKYAQLCLPTKVPLNRQRNGGACQWVLYQATAPLGYTTLLAPAYLPKALHAMAKGNSSIALRGNRPHLLLPEVANAPMSVAITLKNTQWNKLFTMDSGLVQSNAELLGIARQAALLNKIQDTANREKLLQSFHDFFSEASPQNLRSDELNRLKMSQFSRALTLPYTCFTRLDPSNAYLINDWRFANRVPAGNYQYVVDYFLTLEHDLNRKKAYIPYRRANSSEEQYFLPKSIF